MSEIRVFACAWPLPDRGANCTLRSHSSLRRPNTTRAHEIILLVDARRPGELVVPAVAAVGQVLQHVAPESLHRGRDQVVQGGHTVAPSASQARQVGGRTFWDPSKSCLADRPMRTRHHGMAALSICRSRIDADIQRIGRHFAQTN